MCDYYIFNPQLLKIKLYSFVEMRDCDKVLQDYYFRHQLKHLLKENVMCKTFKGK